MAKIYHCNECKRDLIAPTTNDLLKIVQTHGQRKHNMRIYSPEQLRAIRRKIEVYAY